MRVLGLSTFALQQEARARYRLLNLSLIVVLAGVQALEIRQPAGYLFLMSFEADQVSRTLHVRCRIPD